MHGTPPMQALLNSDRIEFGVGYVGLLEVQYAEISCGGSMSSLNVRVYPRREGRTRTESWRYMSMSMKGHSSREVGGSRMVGVDVK